eukprot:5141601-Pyramimonas_sp.AAC.1
MSTPKDTATRSKVKACTRTRTTRADTKYTRSEARGCRCCVSSVLKDKMGYCNPLRAATFSVDTEGLQTP